MSALTLSNQVSTQNLYKFSDSFRIKLGKNEAPHFEKEIRNINEAQAYFRNASPSEKEKLLLRFPALKAQLEFPSQPQKDGYSQSQISAIQKWYITQSNTPKQ